MALPAEAVGRQSGFLAVKSQSLLPGGVLGQIGVEYHGILVGGPLSVEVHVLPGAQARDLSAVFVALALAGFLGSPAFEGVAGILKGVPVQSFRRAIVQDLGPGFLAKVEGHFVRLPLPLGIEGHGALIGGRQVQGLFHSFPAAVGLGVPAQEAVAGTGEGTGGQGCGLVIRDPLLVRHFAGALVGVEADGVGDGGPAGVEGNILRNSFGDFRHFLATLRSIKPPKKAITGAGQGSQGQPLICRAGLRVGIFRIFRNAHVGNFIGQMQVLSIKPFTAINCLPLFPGPRVIDILQFGAKAKGSVFNCAHRYRNRHRCQLFTAT